MSVYCRFFYAAKIPEVDIILGYPWLHTVNPEINWKEQAWWYSIDPEQIFIISPEKFTLKMKEVRQVFMVMLSSFMKAGQSAQIILLKELTDFQNVVATEEELMPSLYEAMMHHIDTENQKILYEPLYNLSSCELRVLHKYLNDALIKNWIQHSVSPVRSLVLFVLKRDENLWLCVNYKGLNKKMIKNCHSLPLIEEILNCLVRFYYFMKLNLTDAYHQI